MRAREKADALKRRKDTQELLEARAKQAEDKQRQKQLLKLQQEDMVRDALMYSMVRNMQCFACKHEVNFLVFLLL